MKICWDNLEKLEYKNGKWYKRNNNGKITQTFIYKEYCKNCKKPFLSHLYIKGLYCSPKCQNTGKHNPMYGKKRPDISGNKNYNTKLSVRKKRSKLMTGHLNPSKRPDVRKKLSELMTGENNAMYKGGYAKKNIPSYDVLKKHLNIYEKIRRNKQDRNVLEVKCIYCDKWFIPKNTNVWHRIQSIKGNMMGENRLYCSENCKKECPIYKRTLWPKGFKKDISREVQPELRQLVFERDNYICQKCEKHQDELKMGLNCHHFEGIEINPIESADIDNCITLCKHCHKFIHKNPCPIKDYRRKKCETAAQSFLPITQH